LVGAVIVWVGELPDNHSDLAHDRKQAFPNAPRAS